MRVIMRAGGFSPFFTQHVAPHRIALFNAEERQRFLVSAASLMRLRSEIRGLTSTAWYNDPKVGMISPHLAYLREGWNSWGHGVFKIGASHEAAQDAIARSRTRRRLLEEGTYAPTAYLGIALREQVLQFAPEVKNGHEH